MIPQLKLKPDERGAIIGQTGTGKSVLATELIPRSGRLAIIDPKRQFDFPDVPIFESANGIVRSRPKRFIYRPKPDMLGNIAEMDKVYRYCFDTGNIFVYTDDVVGVIKRQTYPQYLQVCYQMGRAKNVSMLSCFQRPAWIPTFMVTECRKFYCFRLVKQVDISTVQDFMPDFDNARLPDMHSFLFCDLYSDKPSSLCRIKLG